MIPDLTDPDTWTDEDVDALRLAAIRELERRRNQADIPRQVAELAQKYKDGGGDTADLIPALTPEEAEALNA